ncbi:MAG: glycosyltransferase family A protein [candidate division WOR-3 bacterium]
MIASWKPGRDVRYHPSLSHALGSGAPLILSLDGGASLFKGSLDRFLVELQKPGVSLAYSSYETDSGAVEAMPFNRDITERFPFGPVRAYLSEKLMGTGAEGFTYAWEYHARLVLEERGLLPSAIPEPLYFYEPDLRPRPDLREYWDKGKRGSHDLWEPFSYLNYPPEADSEIREVFYAMLRRREAFLEDFEPERRFPPGKGDYELMASVVIPVRNREQFIGRAIESALAQDFSDYEVIVVDNASEDKTRDVVRNFDDPRLRLIENPNGSIAFALNTGLRAARGKYILQLDSDDAYAPETVRIMVGFMEAHPECGLAISYYQITDENLNPLPGGTVRHLEYDRNNILRCEGAGAVRCWRKEVLLEIGGFDEEFGMYGEDYDAVIKVSERYDVCRVHEVLYFYRRHKGSQDVVQSRSHRLDAKTRIRLRAIERRRALVKSREARGYSKDT